MNQKFLATAIGSFPHADADAAIDILFNSIPEPPALTAKRPDSAVRAAFAVM